MFHFIDNSQGIIVGYSRVILKTENGGNIWVRKTEDNFLQFFKNNYLYKVSFADNINVWILMRSQVLNTENGGVQGFYNQNTLKSLSCNTSPNPFSSKTTIEFNNPNHSKYKLSIFSISGNKVFEKDNIQSHKIEFKRGNLKPGIYLVELKGEKVFRGKMVVE